MAGKTGRPQGRAKSGAKSGVKGKKKGQKKRKKKVKAPAPQFPRLAWSRSPVQKPHSTKKGARGYDRKRAKKQTRRRVDEGSGA